jgi:hypothetical protein
LGQDIDTAKAKLSYIEGTVRIQKPDSEGWTSVGDSSSIITGDKLETAGISKAELALPDSGILRMGANSSIALRGKVDSLSVKGAFCNLLKGDFWINTTGTKTGCDFGITLKSGEYLLLAVPDTVKTISRIAVGTDSTLEVRVYEGQLMVIFSYSSVEADTAHVSRFHSDALDIGGNPPSTFSGINIRGSEKVVISSSGKIVYLGAFMSDDPDENIDWVGWNKARDLNR